MLPDMLLDAQNLHLKGPTSMIFCMIGVLIPFLLEKSALLHCVTGGRNLHDIFDHTNSPIDNEDKKDPNETVPQLNDALTANSHGHSYGAIIEDMRGGSEDKSKPIDEAELTYIQVKTDDGRNVSEKYRIPVRPGCCNRGEGVHFQLKARCINCKTVINTMNESHKSKNCPTIMFPAQSLISIALQPVRGQKQDIVEDLFIRNRKATNVTISHLLLFILSVHSICAGISFGSGNKFGAAIGLFIAIICHKLFAGFALGMSFRQNSVDLRSATAAILTFSSMTPLGVSIGFLASYLTAGQIQLMLSLAFKGIAAGTFIYVSVVEILLEEFEGKDDKMEKLAGFLVGNVAMTLLGYYV
ncbi:hypothetical protein AAMO2058_000033200 [Amorphochlora amoebiformis]